MRRTPELRRAERDAALAEIDAAVAPAAATESEHMLADPRLSPARARLLTRSNVSHHRRISHCMLNQLRREFRPLR